jgi:hypothetical protein
MKIPKDRLALVGWFSLGAMAVLMSLATSVFPDSLYFGDRSIRVMACESLWVAGLAYVAIKKKLPKMVLAVVTIGAGFWTEYYQLGKIAQDSVHNEIYDRLIFVIAAMVVMGHGCEGFLKTLRHEKGSQE